MSSASSARSSTGARSMKSSTSGRWPVVHASTNWLRMRSRSVVTEDLLQLLDAAAAARVDIVGSDVEVRRDLVAGEPFEQGQFKYLSVVVVFDLGDRPGDEFGLLAQALLVGKVLRLDRSALARVPGDRGVVRAPLIAVRVGLVETAGRPLLVAQLLAAEVHARVVHALAQGGAELTKRRRAEPGAHRDHAKERDLDRVVDAVGRQAVAAREAKHLDELGDAVEVLDRELLPELACPTECAAVAVVAEEAENLVLPE